MTISMHFSDLRFARVKTHEDLVVGHRFLLCHVPPEGNPRDEAPVYSTENRITAVAHMSYNEEQRLAGRVVRESRFDSLNDPRWVFRTDGEYARWHHCLDYDMGPAKWERSNFVLDLDGLEAEGVTVLRAYPEPVISTFVVNFYV